MLDLIYKLLETLAQVLVVEFHFEFQWKAWKTGNTYSPISVYFNDQIPAFCVVNGFLCVFSSRKSVSRLICRIASNTTTTRAPHSVTTVVVCCGVSTDKALNVKVSLICSFFKFLNLISPYHFNDAVHCILSPLDRSSDQTVAWTYTATVRRKWPIYVESTRNYLQKLCLKSPRFAQ